MKSNLNNNNKNTKNLTVNDLEKEIWVKRLDMVFDKSSLDGITLKEEEISEYVDFNKKYLKKINDFIDRITKEGYIFICEPEQFKFDEPYYSEDSSVKAEIILSRINKIEFNKIEISNYGFGDPNKIKDLYTVELISKNKQIKIYELSGVDLVRLSFQGSFMDKNGDILALSAQKAIEALNKYFY